MKYNKNRHWFTVIEIVIAISLFVLFITSRVVIDQNSLNAYTDSVKSNNLENLTNDLYAYLYTYKKTYWTSNFINLITKWDLDGNCNWNDFNWNLSISDEIDEYCFIYPYLSWSTILFNQWIINDSNSLLSNVFLLDNNNWWHDWDTYLKLFHEEKSIITIWVKEHFENSDKYTGFIWVFSLDDLKYKYKQNVVFE